MFGKQTAYPLSDRLYEHDYINMLISMIWTRYEHVETSIPGGCSNILCRKIAISHEPNILLTWDQSKNSSGPVEKTQSILCVGV